jgi:hypothetical protein
MRLPSSLEIARSASLKPIEDVAGEMGLCRNAALTQVQAMDTYPCRSVCWLRVVCG